jgi:hypothetical protein
MKARHLQAHVSCLLSHMSEHVSTQHNWWVQGSVSHGICSATCSKLKHGKNTYLISNMSGLGQRPVLHLPSWFGTVQFHILI